MKLWICPRCGHALARRGQVHLCTPAMTVDEYYAGRPSDERTVYDAVAEVLMACGPVEARPTSAGVSFEKRSAFAELRARRRGMVLTFIGARVGGTRIAHCTLLPDGRWLSSVNLRDALEVDAEVRGWLVESYADSPE